MRRQEFITLLGASSLDMGEARHRPQASRGQLGFGDDDKSLDAAAHVKNFTS